MSDQEDSERSKPNILVTGTPGVGKTATATLIAVRIKETNLLAKEEEKCSFSKILL